jgi:hypothetical protein
MGMSQGKIKEFKSFNKKEQKRGKMEFVKNKFENKQLSFFVFVFVFFVLFFFCCV